ncbi:malate synthase A [Paludibacterium paludis]|uniref:Malate synthase n=1 Tax=Paludibacterium paludis TaxID=1225769 RepID=A0A918P4E6_9NEIS|nr:malate synthase A [Paludibacterium paludis]GGY21513.1 malate synthase [Paludibacterium paludis]
MAIRLPQGVEILAPLTPEYETILSYDALSFLAGLHRRFEGRRQELMAAREERQRELDAGRLPDFLAETVDVRNGDWSIAPLPADLLDRRVEITGPVERKMMINALNSGAKSFMADFEDSNCPSWDNQLSGQINVRDAYRKTIGYTSPEGKAYRLNDTIATLLLRPRGWHLMEKHVKVDGKIVSGAIFDFALSFFHNIHYLIEQGSATYYYLPKMESHLEARLWNDIFVEAQEALGVARGTIKATVLIETILAAFEMDEILYELREHSAGLNAGRWDYIFSCIKKFKNNRNFCLANRGMITMTVPFMRSYALLLLKTCHKRNAPAIGGMAALIPIKNDAIANEKALAGVKADKDRDATDGYDGGWVAHPGLVPIAMESFTAVLGERPNQIGKQRQDVHVQAADLLNFQPETPITEAGLRMNINVGIQYLGAWISGNGCVPIHNLMEDAATAEISRSQIWQWIRSPKGVLEDGRKVTVELFRQLAADEVETLKREAGSRWTRQYEDAANMFDLLTTSDDFVEFLTLPGYEYLD